MYVALYWFVQPRLQHFTLSGSSQITTFETHVYPIKNRGLITVGIILALNLFQLTIITTLFLLRTRHTLLGQTWSGLSQLECEEIQNLYQDSTLSTDDEVHKRLEREGFDDPLYRVEGGAARVVRVNWGAWCRNELAVVEYLELKCIVILCETY